jgi:peptidoglycan/LPS O-acetylase OafA/YrhL
MTDQLSHRREIQGLRALAVLAVLVGHLFPTALPGGFLGVDIFFLLSGFLITEQLLNVRGTENALHSLLFFYARRVRRILPSALLVIWVTVWLAFKYLGPVVGNENLVDGRWATLFFANSHFNSLKIDYFVHGSGTPLLQHYWSLAVEEQFYLFWPLLLLAITLIFKVSSRRTLLILLSLISVASFVLIFTTEGSLTYFATSTRVWELSMGAFFAVVGSFKISKVIQIFSLLVIAGSLILVSSENQIPGFAVIPPLVATAFLLRISDKRLANLLGNPIAHYVGDISFVLYLWHWPIIELHRQLSTSALTFKDSLTLLAVTFGAAILTHHLFENPIRLSKYLVSRPKVSLGIGGLATILSVSSTYLLVKG